MSSSMNNSLQLKRLHDRLLAEKPDGAVHDSDGCPLCAMAAEEGAPLNEDYEMTTTFSEDEVRARVEEAVKAATEPLEAQLRALAEAAKTSETEAAVVAVRAEYDAKLAEVTKELDEKVLEAAKAAAERDGILQWLEDEAKTQEEAQALQARKDERLARMKEIASFPDDFLERHAERFAAMSDEDFEAACESWKAQSVSANSGIPATTGLHAGREGGGSAPSSAVKELFAMRRDRGHIDLNTL